MRQEAEGHILDTYSAKARGTRRTRWAGQARLSIKSIVARRPRRTLQRGHKPQDESFDFTLEVLTASVSLVNSIGQNTTDTLAGFDQRTIIC